MDEHANPLLRPLLADADRRQEVFKYRAMYVAADCSTLDGDGNIDQRDLHVLLEIKAYEDGSLTLRPGFASTSGQPSSHEPTVAATPAGHPSSQRSKFQASSGAIYEYLVELSSSTEDRERSKRKTAEEREAAERQMALRAQVVGQGLEPVPGVKPTAARVMVLAEIVAAKGFNR